MLKVVQLLTVIVLMQCGNVLGKDPEQVPFRQALPVVDMTYDISRFHFDVADEIILDPQPPSAEAFVGVDPEIRIHPFRWRITTCEMDLCGKKGRLIWSSEGGYYYTDFEVDAETRDVLRKLCLEKEFLTLGKAYTSEKVKDGPVLYVDVRRPGGNSLKTTQCEGHFPKVIQRLANIFDDQLKKAYGTEGRLATKIPKEEIDVFMGIDRKSSICVPK
jgi:hypothetical protein